MPRLATFGQPVESTPADLWRVNLGIRPRNIERAHILVTIAVTLDILAELIRRKRLPPRESERTHLPCHHNLLQSLVSTA